MESQTRASSGDKITEILYGAENAVGRGVRFMANVKNGMDLCFDYRAPSIVIEVQEYKNGYADVVKRGGKIRVVTEITVENMHYCKELMKLVELHHLEGVKGGIAVNESEYMATTVLEEGKPLTQVIYSNEPEVVAQGHHIFEVFWKNSIDAQQRLLELELGKEPERTEVWRDQSVIVSRSLEILNKLQKKYDFCIDSKGPSIIISLDYIKKAYLDIVARGGKLRLITEIVRDNVSYCKEIAGFAEVRHLDKIKGNFGIVDEKIYGGTASTNENQAPSSYLHSNVTEFVDQQQLFFETLWEKAMPATQRIRELEEGKEPDRLEIIQDTQKSIGRAFELMKATRKEFLILFATARTFNIALTEAYKVYREMLLRGVSVRVLIPRGDNINEIMAKVANLAPGIDVRISDADLNTRISIMVCDRKDFMSWQLRDDSLEDPYEAGGVATFSNISSLAESYATIFDSLWKITEFAEKLRIANARLEDNDRAMKDFIDIAAHELRTPIQPILGLSEVLQSSTHSSSEQRMLIDVIARNARRLEQMAERILDVTRIESGKLHLSLEKVDLDLLTENVIRDIQKTTISSNHQNHGSAARDPTFELVKDDSIRRDASNSSNTAGRPSEDTSMITLGDAHRLEQVISNILSNATKFASGGSIVVKMGKQRDEEGKWHGIISINDNGPGIDSEVLPKLFEKFVSKSEKGLGLGLYLSKRIIDAHGGKIWAKNGSTGSGATFSFSLPLIDEAP